MSNYSYVTLLSSDSYFPGIQLLLASMRYVDTKYPLSVMITPNLADETIEKLKKLNVTLIPVDLIKTPDSIMRHNIATDPQMAETWKHCLTKFQVWNQKQFDKIIMLDCDLMFLKNCDHCFELPDMTAALDGEYFNLWAGWPHFNSGFFTLTPSTTIFNSLVSFANNLDPDIIKDAWGRPYVIADQELLNLYYKDWPNREDLHLSKYYNVFAPHLAEICTEDILQNSYFIHFVGSKPWVHDTTMPVNSFKGVSLATYALGAAFVLLFDQGLEIDRDALQRYLGNCLVYYYNEFEKGGAAMAAIENKTDEDIRQLNYFISLANIEKNFLDSRKFFEIIFNKLSASHDCPLNYYLIFTQLSSYDWLGPNQRIQVLELFELLVNKTSDLLKNIEVI